MTSSHDLVEYIFLEYISGPEFISDVLQNVKTEDDLNRVLYSLVILGIQSFGYDTNLTYRNYQKNFKTDFLKQGIFTFSRDALFGEKCEFALDKYLSYAGLLKSKSTAHARISEQRKVFGDEGLRRALSITALEHKWEPLGTSGSDESEVSQPPQLPARTYLIGEGERQQVLSGLQDLRRTAEKEDLDQEAKAQALALINSAITLVESPSPNWRIIREILYSIAAISTVLSLAIQLAELIR